MASKFLDEQAKREVGVVMEDGGEAKPALETRPSTMPVLEGGKDGEMRQAFLNQQDAPPCPDCGCIMVRNGTCYKCMNCGTTSGCS
jgi:ribonucleoside-diphosphate reductase alpha chain